MVTTAADRALYRLLVESALTAALERRYIADQRTLSQIAVETQRGNGHIRDLIVASGTPLRTGRTLDGNRRRQPSVRTLLRIGYLRTATSACAAITDQEPGKPALAAALAAAGHTVIALPADAEPPAVDRYRLTALVCELVRAHPRRASPAPDDPGSLLHHVAVHRRLPTLIWDADHQLSTHHRLTRMPNVRVTAVTEQPGKLLLPYLAPDWLLDQANPRDAITVQRGRTLTLDHSAGPEPPKTVAELIAAYRNSLAVQLYPPAGQDGLGHHTGRLILAVAHGCLPLLPAGLHGAAELVPAPLRIHNHQHADTLKMLAAIAGTELHRDLLTACLLYLHRHRLSDYTSRVLDALQTLANTGTADPQTSLGASGTDRARTTEPPTGAPATRAVR
ncbi:hypothetical protein ACFY36_51160 [Actinoplanes sp. NPDC000266]